MRFISAGPICDTAWELQEGGLRKESYPFDWVYSTLPMVLHCIEDRFKTFLDKSQYFHVANGIRHTTYNPMLTSDALLEHGKRQNKSISNDDALFLHQNPFDSNVHLTLLRRGERFMEALEDPSTCLVVLNPYADTFDDIIAFAQELGQKYPCRIVGFVKGATGLLIYQKGHLWVYGYQDKGEISSILSEVEAHMKSPATGQEPLELYGSTLI